MNIKDELTRHEVLSVSDARKKFKMLTEDSTAETLLTRDSVPVGIYLGIDSWRAIQDTLDLFKNPEAVLRAQKKHRLFMETGKTENSVSFEDFENAKAKLLAELGIVEDIDFELDDDPPSGSGDQKVANNCS